MNIDAKTSPAGRTPRLNEQVAAELERRIAAGLLRSGDALSEARLAEEFGISRAPVRGALHRLEQVGLIHRAGPNRRSYVVAEVPASWAAAATARPAPARPPKLTTAASWEAIYEDVSRKAAARAAFGSWRITETELAAHYGVSRTVAREVLGRLDHVGIIRKDSRSHWYLPGLSPERVGELYEMRWLLEPVALRKAAPRVPRAVLERIRDEHEAVRDQPGSARPQDLDRLEQQLHVELLSHGDNATLLETLQHYHALLITNAVLYDVTSRGFGADPFVGEHLAILRLVGEGRFDDAAQQLADHLRTARGRAIDRIGYMVRNGALEPLRYLTPLAEERAAPGRAASP